MRNSVKRFGKIDKHDINLSAIAKAIINKGGEKNTTGNSTFPRTETVLLRKENMI